MHCGQQQSLLKVITAAIGRESADSSVAGSHEVLLASYFWRRCKPTLQTTAV